MTYEDISIPEWCDYPDPTLGEKGCWGLISGYVESKAYCIDCDLCNKKDISAEHEKEISDNQAVLRAYLGLLG